MPFLTIIASMKVPAMIDWPTITWCHADGLPSLSRPALIFSTKAER